MAGAPHRGRCGRRWDELGRGVHGGLLGGADWTRRSLPRRGRGSVRRPVERPVKAALALGHWNGRPNPHPDRGKWNSGFLGRWRWSSAIARYRWGAQAAVAAGGPAAARERGRLERAADRRPVGRGAARHGRQERAGVRLAAAQAARATGGSSRGRPATCCGSTRPSSTRALRAAGRRGPGARPADAAADAARGARAVARAAAGRPRLRAVRAGATIARLEELRLGAVEQRIDADLATGRHAELVGELEALVAEHPLRERLRGQLMLALYRSGRQAEALEAYRRRARRSSTSSASSPGRRCASSTRRSSRRTRRSTPAPRRRPARDRPRAGARRVRGPRARAGRAGRGARRRARGPRARRAARRRAGDRQEPARARAVRTRARARRARPRRPLLGGGRRAGVLAVGAGAARYVARASPTRCARGSGRAASSPSCCPSCASCSRSARAAGAEAEGARFRLFEAVSRFLRAPRGRDPLRARARRPARRRRALAAAAAVPRPRDRRQRGCWSWRVPRRRPDAARPAGAGARRAGCASRHDAPDHARRARRGRGRAVHRARRRAPSRRPASSQAIHGETDGNPLFVGEVVRLLDAEGALAGRRRSVRIPPGVRAVIGQRVGAAVRARAASVLAAASRPGPRVRARRARAAERPGARRRCSTLLDEAMAERVVGDVPGAPGRLRFGHALIRDTLYDELTAGAAAATARAGRRGARGGVRRATSSRTSPSWRSTSRRGAAGATEKAVAYARRAGDRAAAQLAYEEAARLYEMALDARRASRRRAASCCSRSARPRRARATRRASKRGLPRGRGARRAPRPRPSASAARRSATAAGSSGRSPATTRGSCRCSSARSPRSAPATARCGSGCSPASPAARCATPASRPERRPALSAEALAMARRLGDPATLAYAIQGYIVGHHSPEHTRRAARARDRDDRRSPRRRATTSASWRGARNASTRCSSSATWRGAKAELEAMAQLAGELRQPSQEWLVTCTAR